MSVIMITGGARSGKSTLAEQKARAFERVVYIATARACDEEMAARISRHRASRPKDWTTVERIHDLHDAVAPDTQCVLLDCVTNLIANVMMDMDADWEHPGDADIQSAEQSVLDTLEALIARVRAAGCTLILVNNEVGLGLVPAYPFGRAFRDIAGRAGQFLAQMSDEVVLCVSGIPIKIK